MTALPPEIEEKLDEIRALCVKYGVKKLTLFGSAARGEFDPERSDFDFLIEFLPGVQLGLKYFEIALKLEEIFGRRVDIVELEHVRNPYRRASIEQNPQVPVYEAA